MACVCVYTCMLMYLVCLCGVCLSVCMLMVRISAGAEGDGEDHEGVLVLEWGGQTHGSADQEDALPPQRSGRRQDLNDQRKPDKKSPRQKKNSTTKQK